jgi:hypothetical protein
MGERRQTHSKAMGNIGLRKGNSCSTGGLKKAGGLKKGLKEDPSKSHGRMTSNSRLVLWESLLAFFQDVNEKHA